MATWKYLLGCWIGLVLLSVGTVWMGSKTATELLAAGILLAALGKAWLIIDGFMEMRHANWFWRCMMLGWPLALASAVFLAFQLR